MASVNEMLQQIADPNLTHEERTLLRCQLAKSLEESGNYKAAREALGELWPRVGERPDLSGLSEVTIAEVLLRVGALTGWIGSAKQIENSQEMAKNLISESLTKFEELRKGKKAAEARIELGYCYWREGAFNEARDVLNDALARLTDDDGDLKAIAMLRLAVVESASFRLYDAFYLLTRASPLFEASGNHILKGRFHGEYATVLKDLSALDPRGNYTDRALIEFAAASYHLELGGHRRYQGCVENNLGFLFSTIGKFKDAHEHLDRAQALFTSLNDSCHIAGVDETRAGVFLAEGRPEMAEKVARKAVAVFERGGEQALLAEALTTHGMALARLGQGERARLVLQRAVEVAERAGDREGAGRAALTICEELFAVLGPDDLQANFERADELLESTLHPVNQRRLLDCMRRMLFRFGGIGEPPTWAGVALDRFADEFEARMIEHALRASGGVITRAAQLLGIKRQRLSNMLHTRHRRLLAALAPAEREVSQTDVDDDDDLSAEGSAGIEGSPRPEDEEEEV